jgi:hypothetical protein
MDDKRNNLQQSLDAMDKMDALIKEITERLQDVYPNTWEDVTRNIILNHDVSQCHDLYVIGLAQQLFEIEERNLTPAMRVVRESQNNLNEMRNKQLTDEDSLDFEV